MLYNYFTEKLLNLQGVLIKNIEKIEGTTYVYLEMPVKEHTCPNCGQKTKYVHDYRSRKIKDLPAFDQNIILVYRQRRYSCNNCKKRFAEENSFVPKYYQMTRRLINKIFVDTEKMCSFSSIGNRLNISVSTVIRIFDIIAYEPPKELPEVIAIDEFKGNAGGEKYQAIITDPQTGVVLDILPDRKQSALIKYMKQYSREERSKVKFFVSDMWKPYAELSEIYFKESIYLVDKYHYIRQIIWAFEKTRKRVQKKYSKHYRLMFKNSKRLLAKRRSKLREDQKEQLEAILYVSDELRIAYNLKEEFYKLLNCKDKQTAKKMMSDWIYAAQDSGISEYNKCSNTLINWQIGILNTFEYPYSNGFTEGCNNQIKVLKRTGYGYRNFKRFRKRILHIFSYQSRNNNEKEVA